MLIWIVNSSGKVKVHTCCLSSEGKYRYYSGPKNFPKKFLNIYIHIYLKYVKKFYISYLRIIGNLDSSTCTDHNVSKCFPKILKICIVVIYIYIKLHKKFQVQIISGRLLTDATCA